MKNQVQLIGRLGMDPEVKVLTNDNVMARMSIATTQYKKNKDGERTEETQWHRVIAWGNIARIAEQYCRKGQEVGVTGKLITRSYETKGGEKKYITEVVISELLLMSKKDQEQQKKATARK